MSYSNWKLSYYEKEEVIQNKMGHFCDKKWCRYFFHFYFKIFKFFIIFFKYLYDIRWKYFNISIFLVLLFLLVCTSFNFETKRFFSDILAALQCFASFRTKLRFSNWIQLVDSVPNIPMFLCIFCQCEINGGGGTFPSPMSNVVSIC